MNDKLIELVNAFKDFRKGIEILENFKLELKNLNTTGFEGEAQEIRAKWNNVDKIPFIRSELKELKEKIQRKEEPKIDLIDKEGHKQKLKVYEETEKEPPASLKKDAKMLEKYGFKVKGIVKFKKN